MVPSTTATGGHVGGFSGGHSRAQGGGAAVGHGAGHGGQLIAEEEQVTGAAHSARSVAEKLAATTPPHTPQISLPFLPELGQFLSALQQARSRHHEATQQLARFYSDAAGSLADFRGRLEGQEQAAQAGFAGLEGGVRS